jgi:uncharacterized lipoprotein YmbA
MSRASALIAIGLGCVIALAGCGSLLAPRPDTSRFFLLTPVADAPPAAAGGTPGLVLGLGPIAFPAYLRRAEVVTRSSDNRIELSATDRWGEPLDDNFKRVLAQDIAATPGVAQVISYPWFSASPHPDFQIAVSVDSFEADAHGTARLIARWTVRDGSGARVIYVSSASLSEPAAAGDSAAAAAALSHVEGEFAAQVVAAVRQLRAQESHV